MSTPHHFPGLDGIRAIAALTVLFYHIDQFTRLFGLAPLGFHTTGLAANAVDLFFVLSGFLITYLLLEERTAAGTIAVRRFYMRRILRIWPAYYLSLAVVLVLSFTGWMPRPEHPAAAIALHVLLLANVAYALGLVIKVAIPLWSVGVEEQFYLLWPHVLRRTRHPARAIIAVALTYLLVKLAAYLIFQPSSGAYRVIWLTRIDVLCLGAIGACLVRMRHVLLRLLFHKAVQVAAWGLFLWTYVHGPFHLYSFIDQQLNAVLYLVLILNVAANPGTLVRLEHPLLRGIGRISYGIYVYHMIVLYLVSGTLARLGWTVSHLGIYLLVVPLTLGIAYVSYRWYESFFLRRRSRYAAL